MPVEGSNIERRTSPESTTTRTPWMVRLVSAMLVARTTLRVPGEDGASAASWSSGASSPKSGRTRTSCAARPCCPMRPGCARRRPACSDDSVRSAASINDWTRRISRAPGRNTSTSPVSSRRARRTSCAVIFSGESMGPPGPNGGPGRGGAPFPAKRDSTGNVRPSDVTIGASPKSRATASPSSVADMTSTLRSGVRFSRASNTSANPRSACKLRSWNSSKITTAIPSSAGSVCNMRVRTPSVTTSTRVSRETRVSMRIR